MAYRSFIPSWEFSFLLRWNLPAIRKTNPNGDRSKLEVSIYFTRHSQEQSTSFNLNKLLHQWPSLNSAASNHEVVVDCFRQSLDNVYCNTPDGLRTIYGELDRRKILLYNNYDTNYSVDIVSIIPKNIICLFMNSHLWPLNEYANWVKAPFVKLEEANNNNLIISCMHMLVMSKSPHKALLLLHELPECNKERLQSFCTG